MLHRLYLIDSVSSIPSNDQQAQFPLPEPCLKWIRATSGRRRIGETTVFDVTLADRSTLRIHVMTVWPLPTIRSPLDDSIAALVQDYLKRPDLHGIRLANATVKDICDSFT
jgi:hypothetical protein